MVLTKEILLSTTQLLKTTIASVTETSDTASDTFKFFIQLIQVVKV